MKNIGQQIKIERLKRQISQAKLAKLLHLNQVMLSDWETGKKDIPTKIKLSIFDLFDKIDKLNEKQKDSLFQRRKYVQKRYDVIPNGKMFYQNEKNVLISNEVVSLKEQYHARVKNDKPKGIALFAGCGGLSLGFHNAGFDVIGFVELQGDFHVTYKKNFPNSLLLGTDVRNVSNKEVENWLDAFGEIDILFGGPPCQGFSLAGKRDVFDPRNQLYKEFARIASILKPKTILLENVRLLTSMKTADGIYAAEDIVKSFENAGYRMTYKVVNAKDYGVPQSRERVIFIGIRIGITDKTIFFPDPTHGPKNDNLLFQLKPYVTFRDATGDLESLESGERSSKDPLHFAIVHPKHVIDWLRGIPEGESAHNNPNPNLRPKSGYNTTYKRIRWDETCSTISTNFSMISGSRNVHPHNTRSLTIREAARCQTFPDNFTWEGKWGTIRTMIGNAVPPLLAEIMARHILENYIRTEPKIHFTTEIQEAYRNIPLPG